MSVEPDPNLHIYAVDAADAVAQRLIDELCSELSALYGTRVSPFAPEESRGPRGVFLIAELAGDAVGCGAFRPLDEQTAEIKRMFVAPRGRRRGVARAILRELERRAPSAGYTTLRLETGIYQQEAIGLYEAEGYRRIDPFGHYVGNPISVCFEKTLPAER